MYIVDRIALNNRRTRDDSEFGSQNRVGRGLQGIVFFEIIQARTLNQEASGIIASLQFLLASYFAASCVSHAVAFAHCFALTLSHLANHPTSACQ